MTTAYITLVKAAIAHNFSVSVHDGEEWAVKRSHNLSEINTAVKSVDEAELRFRDEHGNPTGWALVSAYGLEPDETVIDSTTQDWINNALISTDLHSA